MTLSSLLVDTLLTSTSTRLDPVHVTGASREIGDGHAAQGDGEVDTTALGTSRTGTLQIIGPSDLRLAVPMSIFVEPAK